MLFLERSSTHLRKGDAKAVAAFWAEDGDYVDVNGRFSLRAQTAEPTIKNKLICGMIAGVMMLPIMLAIQSQQAGQQATEQRQAAQIKAKTAAYQQEKRH